MGSSSSLRKSSTGIVLLIGCRSDLRSLGTVHSRNRQFALCLEALNSGSQWPTGVSALGEDGLLTFKILPVSLGRSDTCASTYLQNDREQHRQDEPSCPVLERDSESGSFSAFEQGDVYDVDLLDYH